MKRAFWGLLLLFPFVLFGEPEKFLLVENGKSAASIQIPTWGLAAFGGRKFFDMRTKEFNRTLKAVSGAELPLVSSSAGRVIKWKLVMKPVAPVDQGSFSISFPNKKTMLVTLYGPDFNRFYNYLIQTVSRAEYLSPEKCGLDAPRKKTLSFPMKNVTVSGSSFPLGRIVWVLPEIRYQWDMASSSLYYTHDLPRFAFQPAKYKNGYPPEVMPVLNGKKILFPPVKNRPDAWWQPCYGNKKCAAIAVENILEYLKKNPWVKCVGLGINDLGGFCECDLCRKANGNRKGSDKSNVYYSWVNLVAEGVTKVYPNMRFGLLAYRETQQAPDFKLHANVVPVLTFDLFSCIDPQVRKKHEKLIVAWSKKASRLGVWDYSWGARYWIPRVAYKCHAEMLKFLHKHNCRFYFGENEFVTISDGPKTYLVSKLLQNIHADPEAILNDWFRRCAGEKGAPHLKRYYKRCEDFYRSNAMRKTPWYVSCNNVYMTMNDPSWMNALSSGTLNAMEEDLNLALAGAGTPEEKARVKEIRKHFDFARVKAKLSGAEYLTPAGILKNKQDALKLIASLRNSATYIREGQKIADSWLKGEFGSLYKRYTLRGGFNGTQESLAALTKLLPLAGDPEVKKALLALSRDKKVPSLLAGTADALASLDKKRSLFPNSSFEAPLNTKNISFGKNRAFQRSQKFPRTGKYSLRALPGRIRGLSLYTPVKEGKNYLVVARIYTPDSNPEAFADMAAWAQIKRKNLQWRNMAKLPIPAGSWQDLVTVATIPAGKKVDELRIYFEFGNFDPGQELFIDDIMLLEL